MVRRNLLGLSRVFTHRHAASMKFSAFCSTTGFFSLVVSHSLSLMAERKHFRLLRSTVNLRGEQLRSARYGLLPLKWQASGKQAFAASLRLYRNSLILNRASDGIRTRDLSITNRLHYHCATLAEKPDALRDCENAGFAMRFYREAASRTIFSRAGAACLTRTLGPVIFT
jgi:hypothetical protein